MRALRFDVLVEPLGPELIVGADVCCECGATLVAAALVHVTVGEATRLLGKRVCAVCATPV